MLKTRAATGLERRLEKGLTARGYCFEPEYPTRSGFIIDFMVFVEKDGAEVGRIAVEADGERWHQDEWRRKFRDKILLKDDRIKVVLHFWGREINEELTKCLDMVGGTIKIITETWMI